MKTERRRRRFPGRLFLLLLILAGTCPQSSGALSRPPRNVLLITVDTLRPDRLSCYSKDHLETPHIDGLASRGVVFDRAFAHTPLTLPSHANILLGTTPPYHGVHDNSTFKVQERFLTLAEYLGEKGYATGAFIGAFPLDSRFGLSQGFEVYDEAYPTGASQAFSPPERRAEEVVRAAVDWLEDRRTRWFCWVHLWDPHAVYSPPEPFLSRFSEDPYSGEVAYVDTELGKLFDFLEKRDQAEETLVILTGDHGESLGEHGELTHGYFAYNSTLWVPLIIAAPGLKPGRSDQYVCHADIFPTVCDLLGLEKPGHLQGTSLLRALEGKKLQDRAIYFESLSPYLSLGAAPLRGFIEGGKKFSDSPLPECYDLEDDFEEKSNLVEEAEAAGNKKKLESLLSELSSGRLKERPRELDREALEKLRSLGYISSVYSRPKERYGPEDDLKTLLPVHQKLDRAVILYDEGRGEESVRLLKDIIDAREDMAQAYLYLYQIYKNRGMMKEALAVLEQGREKCPRNYDLLAAYGIFLVEKGELDEGIEAVRKALEWMDFDPLLWNNLGFAYLQKGEEARALECYRKALSLDENHAMTHANLGWLYLSRFARTRDEADYARAMESFKRAITFDPELAVAYKWLGMGYKLAGRLEEAISLWEKTLELSPEDDFVLLNLGKALLEKGDKERARSYLETYLRLKAGSLSPRERREVQALIQKSKAR